VRAVVVAREGVAVRATGARACGDVGAWGVVWLSVTFEYARTRRRRRETTRVG